MYAGCSFLPSIGKKLRFFVSAQPPFSTCGIYLAHMSGRGVIKILIIFRLFNKENQKSPSPNFCHPKSYFVCDLKLHDKLQSHMLSASDRKVNEAERKKEEEKCR
jgi:hypothetical protein